jgi:hypothetical protein
VLVMMMMMMMVMMMMMMMMNQWSHYNTKSIIMLDQE